MLLLQAFSRLSQQYIHVCSQYPVPRITVYSNDTLTENTITSFPIPSNSLYTTPHNSPNCLTVKFCSRHSLKHYSMYKTPDFNHSAHIMTFDVLSAGFCPSVRVRFVYHWSCFTSHIHSLISCIQFLLLSLSSDLHHDEKNIIALLRVYAAFIGI